MSNQGRTPGFPSVVSPREIACQCLRSREIAGIFDGMTSIANLAEASYPALVAARLVDAVLAAQLANGGQPVPAELARVASAPPVALTAQAFTRLARKVSQLGADERGRLLVPAGTDRNGTALWWVHEAALLTVPAEPALTVPTDLAARLERAAHAHGLPPADALRALLEPALTTIESSAPAPADLDPWGAP